MILEVLGVFVGGHAAYELFNHEVTESYGFEVLAVRLDLFVAEPPGVLDAPFLPRLDESENASDDCAA